MDKQGRLGLGCQRLYRVDPWWQGWVISSQTPGPSGLSSGSIMIPIAFLKVILGTYSRLMSPCPLVTCSRLTGRNFCLTIGFGWRSKSGIWLEAWQRWSKCPRSPGGWLYWVFLWPLHHALCYLFSKAVIEKIEARTASLQLLSKMLLYTFKVPPFSPQIYTLLS